jgi:hypothetical protein
MMRYLLTCALLLCAAAATALPADLGPAATPAVKTDAHVLAHQAWDREGGETIATAVVIPSLPYNDSGATCDNVNDYDAVCPYTGSTAPDVVYRYTSPYTQDVIVDLCGSTYDTKVYVLDESLQVVACNDDYYSGQPCGQYVSRIDCFQFGAGQTYYLVVDGYGNDCGTYQLSLNLPVPCLVTCPAGSALEGEPPLHDQYVDTYNSGCSGPTESEFQVLQPQGGGALTFCGVSGWYHFDGLEYRDTDWFVATIGATGAIEIRGDGDQATNFLYLAPPSCADLQVVQNIAFGPCQPASMTITGAPGTAVWLWAGAPTFTPPDCFWGTEYDYVLWLTGLQDVVTVEPSTWSTLKALYD